MSVCEQHLMVGIDIWLCFLYMWYKDGDKSDVTQRQRFSKACNATPLRHKLRTKLRMHTDRKSVV